MARTTRREFLKLMGIGAASLAVPRWLHGASASGKSPNILFCISDDQSWLHTSVAGAKAVDTPAFDRVAEEGVIFTNAYCAAPSCTPSRSAILTGQEIWRLEQGGMLFGSLPSRFQVYPSILRQAGYHVGSTGKGWAPGNAGAGGWKEDPAGKPYRSIKCESPAGISNIDYAANFEAFLHDKLKDTPFCFWSGHYEPHRGYLKGAGVKAGKKLEDVEVPDFLPDTAEVRSDILDYFVEIEWHDSHLRRMLALLEKAGELDNTIVVATSDNGMPFPRCKATLYDFGVRMPLAVRWGDRVKGGRASGQFVSLSDVAPTFLECAGLEIPEAMTGISLMPSLTASDAAPAKRDCVYTARERHTVCRDGDLGYPARAIRTGEFLYIHNYAPDRWPAGDPEKRSVHGFVYGDIDPGPTKQYMMQHRDDPETRPLFELAFGKRPEEELYDVKNDPSQMKNLAQDTEFAKNKNALRSRLDAYLRKTNDPRAEGKSPWDSYPYYMGNPEGIVPYSKYQETITKPKD